MFAKLKKNTQNIDQNSWARMHVVVPQNLPISVQGFFGDSSSLQAFYFSGTFQFFNVHIILKLTKSMRTFSPKYNKVTN